MELRLNKSGTGRIFDKQLPVFNIFYPSQHDIQNGDVFIDGISALQDNDFSQTRSVALSFHFPFCDTICNFCPFTRGITPITRSSRITSLPWARKSAPRMRLANSSPCRCRRSSLVVERRRF